MEINHGYGQRSDMDDIRKLYVPINLHGYPLPVEKKIPYKLPFKNELADHIFNIIDQRSSAKKDQGTIDEIFEDRLTLIRSKIELILLQIEQRKEIHGKIHYRIDYDSCSAQNLLYAMGTRIYDVDRDRITIEKMIFDFEEQKRREDTNYFGDTSLLNRELREALIQYQEEVQKSALITDMEEGP